MPIFIYDKSFEGLLSVVFDAFTLKTFPRELYGLDDILPLTASKIHQVTITPEKHRRVFTALQKKLSPFALRSLLYAWLSEQPSSDLALYRYICKVLKSTKSIESDLADPHIWEISNLQRKVSKESERLMGFARFQKSKENIYFSAIAPKYNVLPLMIGHFSERLHDQRWILYDLTRRYGILQKNGSFSEILLDERHLLDGFLRAEFLAEGEMLLEELWRVYFNSTAIAERRNPRLQRNCMPKRFWQYLTEKRAVPAGDKAASSAQPNPMDE